MIANNSLCHVMEEEQEHRGSSTEERESHQFQRIIRTIFTFLMMDQIDSSLKDMNLQWIIQNKKPNNSSKTLIINSVSLT